MSSPLYKSSVRLSVPCLVLRSQGLPGRTSPKYGGTQVWSSSSVVGSRPWLFVICADFSLLRLLGRAGKPLARAFCVQSSDCDSRWGTGTERELGVLTANSLVPEVASHQGQIAHLGCLGLLATLRARKVQPTKVHRPRLSSGPSHPVSQAGPEPGLLLLVRGRLA